jgi:hypothetical protein
MDRVDINRKAVELLDALLERCTLNLVSKITGITRVTLYRWLDESIALDDMNPRDAAWLILQCETNPKLVLLMSKPPMSKPRLAKRVIESELGEDNE